MIFVDTSFWFARSAPTDVRHDEARELHRAHAGEPLLTTDRVLEETWTLLRRRRGHAAAVDTLHRVRASPRVEVWSVDAALAAETWRWLDRHDEREYSFVDASSYACMRKGRVPRAFAFDGDFSAAGFVELRA